MGNLTWGGYTICDTSAGGVYRQVGVYGMPDLDSRSVAFPFSAGREVQVTGSRQTTESSQRVAFDVFVFKATEAAMLAWLVGLKARTANPLYVLGQLVFSIPNNAATPETINNCRAKFGFDRVRVCEDGTKYRAHFTAYFEEYYGG